MSVGEASGMKATVEIRRGEGKEITLLQNTQQTESWGWHDWECARVWVYVCLCESREIHGGVK